MKDRLNKLLETEGLSPSSFADKLGIQRPNVSHVLSGRNNPGYEFIQKILLSFPKLNAEWLLLGNGDMYKSGHNADSLNDLFSGTVKQTVSASPPLSSPTLSGNPAAQAESTLAENKKIVLPPDETEISPAKVQKAIDRIVILFSDKTFSDYSPA